MGAVFGRVVRFVLLRDRRISELKRKMQKKEDGEMESVSAAPQSSSLPEWSNFGDDDIMAQQYSIQADEAKKVPFVADKVIPISILL